VTATSILATPPSLRTLTASTLEKVSSWVGTRLSYVPGSSDPIDGAADTLLAGAGVCRDYAHLVIALLRAVNVPARLVSVYAPGCHPMDFHAVAEAFVDGQWRVVDATCLAPRQSMVRIATGRDAADTAFLDNHKGSITLNSATNAYIMGWSGPHATFANLDAAGNLLNTGLISNRFADLDSFAVRYNSTSGTALAVGQDQLTYDVAGAELNAGGAPIAVPRHEFVAAPYVPEDGVMGEGRAIEWLRDRNFRVVAAR